MPECNGNCCHDFPVKSPCHEFCHESVNHSSDTRFCLYSRPCLLRHHPLIHAHARLNNHPNIQVQDEQDDRDHHGDRDDCLLHILCRNNGWVPVRFCHVPDLRVPLQKLEK
jgi:hypothetical protein